MPVSQIECRMRFAILVILTLAALLSSYGNDGVGPRFGLIVNSLNPSALEALGLPGDTTGVLICDVKAGSVAEAGGLRIGDVIQEVNGNSVENMAAYKRAMQDVDTMVMFLINRRGERYHVALEGPAEPVG